MIYSVFVNIQNNGQNIKMKYKMVMGNKIINLNKLQKTQSRKVVGEDIVKG